MAKAAKKTQRPAVAATDGKPAAGAAKAKKPAKGGKGLPPSKGGKRVPPPKGRKRVMPSPKPVASEDGPADGRITRLAQAVEAVRAGRHSSPRTAKLLSGGIPKMAQKLVEEAAETAIDAVRAQRAGLVNESADLLYNLVVLWLACGVAPGEIWAEMDRREQLLGMAEKLPKPDEGAG